MLNIAIIGCGNMGLTYARSFLQYNLVSHDHLLLVARSEAHGQHLKALNLGKVASRIDDRLSESGVVVLAVKPQDFAALAPALQEALKPHHVVLSVMAGITLATLQEALGHEVVIRAMPNTPSQLGMGVTAFATTEAVNIHQIRMIDNLLNTTGRTLQLEDEHLLDAVTALSGSGPAYFFLFVKTLIETGRQMGLEDSVAAMLVKQTMLGSFHLMNQSPRALDDLIAAVTSKGGTTEAAFKVFKAGHLPETLHNGVIAARDRAAELSKGK